MVGSIIGALAVIVVLSAAILAVVSTLPANFLPSTSRVVPSVIGKTFDQAKAAVTGVGLKVVRAQKVDPTGTLDTVVSASPPVGAQLEVGATVTLTVIVGALQVNVPDLTGMSIDAATEALSKLGLTLGETSEVASAAVGKGLILSSTPAVGTPVSQGTPIAISLASGDIAALSVFHFPPPAYSSQE
jgi:serine/threonine-protein kinase